MAPWLMASPDVAPSAPPSGPVASGRWAWGPSADPVDAVLYGIGIWGDPTAILVCVIFLCWNSAAAISVVQISREMMHGTSAPLHTIIGRCLCVVPVVLVGIIVPFFLGGLLGCLVVVLLPCERSTTREPLRVSPTHTYSCAPVLVAQMASGSAAHGGGATDSRTR